MVISILDVVSRYSSPNVKKKTMSEYSAHAEDVVFGSPVPGPEKDQADYGLVFFPIQVF